MIMRKNRTVLASVGMFAGITAGLVALFAPTAQATGDQAPARHSRDCTRVPADVRTLCTGVRGQLPYTYAGSGGLNQVVSGQLIVQEIAHSGLTPREMRSALRGHTAAYRAHVLNTRTVAVDLTSLARLCGTDGQFVVGFTDDGGRKSTRVGIDCP
jgi:hypothetical protein